VKHGVVIQLLQRPVITEKSTGLQQFGQYVFAVPVAASKQEIRRAVEEMFGVRVTSVRTANILRVKRRLRRPGRVLERWKKAYVQLAPGQTIELFDLS
jgi:large subunit ribosomal protein L23